MALVAPFLFTLFFASLEFSRANVLRHAIQTAAYEGARAGIVPGATADNVQSEAATVLAAIGAVNVTVTVDPEVIQPNTTEVTVTVTIPLDDNGWVVPKFFSGRTLTSTVNLNREHVDEFSF